MWPDPNDVADGRGRAVAPRLVEISARSPAWMTDPEPWGGSKPRWWVPPEQESPRGPAFQPARWDPEAFAAGARPCQAGCDDVGECDAPEKALTVAALAPAGARAAAGQAAAECASGWCQGVRMRGPAEVIAIVNSKWAASEPSWE